jgi:hypothetical protein
MYMYIDNMFIIRRQISFSGVWRPLPLAVAFPPVWRYHLATMTRPAAKRRQLEIRPPAFYFDEEERTFWERHNPGDYLPSTRPVKVQVSRRIRERVRER